MGWFVALLLSLAAPVQQASTDILLSGRTIDLPPAGLVSAREPASFDLLDFRDEQRERAIAHPDGETRSIFGLKRHIGFAGGYDNETIHGSIGWYVTVAEWGRWNFGIPSPAIGFGRYGTYNQRLQRVVTTTDYTLMISLASIHYRAGHIKALDMNWYVNVEQVFDVRANMPGSQIGISLSRK